MQKFVFSMDGSEICSRYRGLISSLIYVTFFSLFAISDLTRLSVPFIAMTTWSGRQYDLGLLLKATKNFAGVATIVRSCLRWELFKNTRFRFNGVCIANNPTTRSERIRKFEMYTPHQKGLQMTRPMKCKNLISLSLNIIGENMDVRIILILLVLDYMLHNLP